MAWLPSWEARDKSANSNPRQSPEPREKKTPTFRSSGCLIGILMVCYNPHITGQYNPLYTLNNQVFFHCSPSLAPSCPPDMAPASSVTERGRRVWCEPMHSAPLWACWGNDPVSHFKTLGHSQYLAVAVSLTLVMRPHTCRPPVY